MQMLQMKMWSPYTVGALIGALNVAALLLSNKLLGASTSFVKLSGLIKGLFNKEDVDNNAYYAKTTLSIDWGFMLVVGIIIGSFVSARLSSDFAWTLVPQMWALEISSSTIARFAVALLGGIVLGIGARWAGGCTSGHGISGTSQLSILSWAAAISFFVGGIIAALTIYGI